MGRTKKKKKKKNHSGSSSGGAQRRRNRMEPPSGNERFHGVQSLPQRRRRRTRRSTQDDTRRSLGREQQENTRRQLSDVRDLLRNNRRQLRDSRDRLRNAIQEAIGMHRETEFNTPTLFDLFSMSLGNQGEEVSEIVIIDLDDPDPDVEIIESFTVTRIPHRGRQRPARAMTTDNRSGNVVSFQKNGINYKFTTYSKGLLEFKVDGVTIRANYVTKQLENMKTKQPVTNMVLEIKPLGTSPGIHPNTKIYSYKSTPPAKFQVEVIGNQVGVFGIPPLKFMFGEAPVTKVRPDIPVQEGGSQGCQICYENRINVIFNCGHGTCTACSRKLEKTICPFCSQKIKNKIPLFVDVRPILCLKKIDHLI